MIVADWRSDPAWTCVSYVEPLWKKPPTDRPPDIAELSTDGAWCSVYYQHRPAATWFRPVVPPTPKKKKKGG